MSTQVSLRCRCGTVRGVATDVSPASGNRVVCYCDDCQAFARFLDRDDVMNAAGGTEIFQMPPANVRLTEGAAALRCVRLGPKGMHRFYTECCKTAVGNTISARVPFVGLIHSFMDAERDGHTRDEVLGRAVTSIHGKFAIGTAPTGVHAGVPLAMIATIVRRLATWWITGKGTPTPFFDARTGVPRAEPRVLTAAQRDALRHA
jgi:hypothetical protein